ncbi:MAG: DNA polymerase III subunit gamma/tau [Deltaproteobacteria bacterium]|nr:DNA polymerase III subunit gamma/tau [Deltaproteobacteria bacterium]
MSYQVLARRWRPQTFEKVVGQSHVTRTLQNAITKERIPHAFLFSGPRGVGKTSVARILAKALNCQHGPAQTPCNQCTQCREISHGISVDVFEIDGASNTGVDEVRGLQENARYLPANSRYKIYIIDEVHMLSKPAFNALLKTLEEPPPHVIFVFATTEPNRIPATIHSRCQRFEFKRLSLKDLLGQLSRMAQDEHVEISERGLYLLAREADGSMRDAQSLLDQVIAFAGQKITDTDVIEALGVVDLGLLISLAGAAVEHNPSSCLKLVQEAHQQGYDPWQLHQELLRCFRNMLVIRTCKDDIPLLDIAEAEYAELKELACSTSQEDLHHLFSILMQCESDMRRSAQPLMVLEVALLHMASTEPVSRLSDILEHLERVEKGLERHRLTADSEKRPPCIQQIERSEEARPEAEDRLLSRQFPTPSSGSSGEEETEELPESGHLWDRLVNHVIQKNPKLGSFLQNGKMIKFGGGRIEVAFDNEICYSRVAEDKTNRSQTENLMRELFSGPIEISFVHTPMKENNNREPPGENGSIQDKVQKNPAFQMILSEFETSKLVEVKPISS